MHKRLVNECLIDFEIRSEGPLLVKSGLPGIEGPDMAPVVTFRNRPRPEPYIPGSSLKGILRSHAERIVRTLCNSPDDWRIGTCDLFKANKKEEDWAEKYGACAVKFEERKKPGEKSCRLGRKPEEITGAIAYRDSCPICKICGNTFLIGRLSVPDAYLLPNSEYRLERRDGVGIDRFTGGSAQGAKFDLEAVTNAIFETRLKLTNFELWQLGLLAFVLRDVIEGLVPVGSGKSRGLGQVSAIVRQIELCMTGYGLPESGPPQFYGLWALDGSAREEYKYWDKEQEGVLLDNAVPVSDPLGLRKIYQMEGESIRGLWRQVAPIANNYLENYVVPTPMRLNSEEERRE